MNNPSDEAKLHAVRPVIFTIGKDGTQTVELHYNPWGNFVSMGPVALSEIKKSDFKRIHAFFREDGTRQVRRARMMARGLRREVRNDSAWVNESRDQMMSRTRDDYFNRSKPSSNKPKYRREVPAGCISVYRVHKWDGKRNVYFGIYRDEALAYQVADAEWDKVVKYGCWNRHERIRVEVEPKAALLIGDRFYIVNLDPIKFTEPPECVAVLLGGTGSQEGALP
jgi:hypothetical protein